MLLILLPLLPGHPEDYADSPGAQWTEPYLQPTVGISIISPGYKGAHALQLDFPSTNVSGFTFLQRMGLQCGGATYSTSFAVNYLKFSLHGNPKTNFCYLSVVSSYCFSYPPTTPELGYYNASLNPGWEYYTYLCTARKSGYADFVIGVGCEADYNYPAFTWLVTDFDIHLVGTSISSLSTPSQSTPMPTPPPTSSTSPSYSNSISGPTTTPSITLSAPTITTNVPTSRITASNNLTSPSVVTTNKACRALEARFFLGPMGVVLLLSYVVY
jgi:hypothetical protein